MASFVNNVTSSIRSSPPPPPPPPQSTSGVHPVDPITRFHLTDSSSPYYIHPAENLSQPLVMPLLTETNYSSWCRAMTMALGTKNKIQFLDGTIVKPLSTNLLAPLWDRNNKLLLGWILKSVSPTIARSFMWYNLDIEVWIALRERFSRGSNHRIAELQEHIFSLKQGFSSVSEFFTELTSLWDKLANFCPVPPCRCVEACTPVSCGLTFVRRQRQSDVVIRFLRGLNDSYSTPRSQIMLMNPLPPLNEVFSLMVEQEQQLKIPPSVPAIDSMAFASQTLAPSGLAVSSAQPPIRAYSSGNYHGSMHRPPGQNKYKPPSARPQCTYCGGTGHTIDRCYERIGYPPGYKKSRSSAHCVSSDVPPVDWNTIQNTYQQMVQFMAQHTPATQNSSVISVPASTSQACSITTIPPLDDSVSGTPIFVNSICTPSKPIWILDTGATDRIISDVNLFTSYMPASALFFINYAIGSQTIN
ncbi:Retrovirus-related Pol polyprotein from transposon RE1 [Linum perenne]